MRKFGLAVALGSALLTSSAMAQALDPAVQKFVDGLEGAKPIYTLTPQEARDVLDTVQSGPAAAPAVDVTEKTLATGPFGKTKVVVYRPRGVTGTLPILMYYHGAGWVMGGQKTHDRLVRELTVGAGTVTVFVDYLRSPESQFPGAVAEDYEVTEYVAKHANEFGGDPDRIAIAGDSVGGNMTAVVSMMSKDRSGPKFKAQLLFYPVTDAGMATGSYQQFADGPWLTKPAMQWFWNAYLPNAAIWTTPHVSPLRATTDYLKGLPPALVITAQNDVLRDEGEAYAKKLADAGVSVTQTRYDGTIHDFVMLNALSQTKPTRAAIAQAIDFLKAKLAK
ncbi:acetyl esterase [Sphingobium sp. AP50]|uniref:alpha/beta hydrolase n=1 Tax=Sphingobium sp. AP50 TaxID=1884369 RepID=UPI0008C8BA42|nr:alpha/beta hydrolase [Sphingobium sp. AP50]SEJ81304.1 acetyl esterase [Sphingobium sp. AP50]